jgi:hypothetical protein
LKRRARCQLWLTVSFEGKEHHLYMHLNKFPMPRLVLQIVPHTQKKRRQIVVSCSERLWPKLAHHEQLQSNKDTLAGVRDHDQHHISPEPAHTLPHPHSCIVPLEVKGSRARANRQILRLTYGNMHLKSLSHNLIKKTVQSAALFRSFNGCADIKHR